MHTTYWPSQNVKGVFKIKVRSFSINFEINMWPKFPFLEIRTSSVETTCWFPVIKVL